MKTSRDPLNQDSGHAKLYTTCQRAYATAVGPRLMQSIHSQIHGLCGNGFVIGFFSFLCRGFPADHHEVQMTDAADQYKAELFRTYLDESGDLATGVCHYRVLPDPP
jgi:hypothetical protein